ncbi:hypothetical protein P154DRAFT_428370 [Amniculicola lignicola CBS 123094]|uniref:C2H2-type domain-containing protein n=1 Tax=Amniculicola lignicola CBS 123094 TaxID=1392246 RepID=A0A6A5WPI0_9PLEO|nr:hypothetical protein P154DRAFT_428370 [Amniculicola lignicola CBS 123094]
MTQRSLATSAIECARLLIDLCAQLNTKECGTRTALSQPAVEDQSARYKIWAGNLGAFQRLPSTSCLDYRVRESPKVATQIQELLEDLRDALQDASPRDRFARALATRQEPFDDRFDIDHVSHKFPILNDREWLKERVGKAITQRRQYLRYARDHRDKLAKEPQDLWQPEDAGKTYLPKPTSTLAPTAASTLHLDGVLVQETNFQDTQSQTSYAVSLGEGDDESCLQLPSLAEVSKDANTFECPLCWTIQDIGKESTWRKHGFADLKPYICTFEDCDVKLFSDRREWFEHELLYHRAQWHCAFCGRDDFRSIKAFQDHVHSRHMQSMTDVQLDALSEASRRFVDRVPALDCPFCHEWEAKLRQANPDIPASEVVVVTPIQFRHHVGAHMQQLALFSIPRGFLEDNADAKSVASLGSPRSNGAGLRKAEMALQYGSPEDIQNEIQNLLKRPQNNAEVHSLLGKCYYKIGNRGLAFTHDRRARDLRASPQREETETDHSTKASVDDRINWSTDDKEVSDSYVENDEEMIMVTDAPSVYHWLISLFQDLYVLYWCAPSAIQSLT